MNDQLPDIIPEDLKKKGIYLKDTLGVLEYAWSYDNAKKVLKYLTDNGYIVHGGDVLKKEMGKLTYVIPGWFYEEDENKSKEENIKASYIKSVETLDWYHNNFGDEYLYVIVFKKLEF